MFAHVLAVLVGVSSFLFYMAAFFYPEVQRPLDWVWSALGLFYAGVLWFGAEQMTSVALLGQVVATTLLLALGWQSLSIRREKTPVYQQTPVVLTPEVVSEWTKSKLNQLRIAPEETSRPLSTQNRSLNATAAERFRHASDPRRRPVYDYEFVEDGLVEAEPKSQLSEELPATAEASAKEDVLVTDYRTVGLAIEEDVQADASIDSGLVPPSVEAEVLAQKEPLSQPISASSSQPAPATEPTSKPTPEPTSAEPQLVDADTDWPDEILPNEASPEGDLQNGSLQNGNLPSEDLPDGNLPKDDLSKQPQNHQIPATEKPSLLATPIILFGWVKDVIGSLTRPKPSKPVIDIPRRESATTTTEPTSSPANSEPDSSFDPPSRAPTAATGWPEDSNSANFDDDNTDQFDDDNSANFDDDNTGQFDDDNSANFDDDSRWEDSNWDD